MFHTVYRPGYISGRRLATVEVRNTECLDILSKGFALDIPPKNGAI